MESTSIQKSRKRRRPVSACEPCRRRKVRCNQQLPCDQCTRPTSVDRCIYSSSGLSENPATFNRNVSATLATETSERIPLAFKAPLSPATTNISAYETAVVIPQNGCKVDQIPTDLASSSASLSKVDRAQEQHSAFMRIEAQTSRATTEIPMNDEPHQEDAVYAVYPALKKDVQKQTLKGVMSKTRFFGQTHWMYNALQAPRALQLYQVMIAGQTNETLQILNKCKRLGRSAKSYKHQPAVMSMDLNTCIPPRDECEPLVQAYLKTFECVYRVLHIPSFCAEYEEYWMDSSLAKPAFIATLALVLATGASVKRSTMYNEPLRDKILHWISQADLWLNVPFMEKSRLTLPALQVCCLLHIAREANTISADLLSMTAASTLRKAMQMGLHRDPGQIPRMTSMQCEMRRRLWATTLELNLQACLTAGTPPLISDADYDTLPPLNINDEVLLQDSDLTPQSKHSNQLTDTSFQISLYKSVPLRLKISKALNGIGEELSFDDTLRLGRELNHSYNMINSIRGCRIDVSGIRTSFGNQLYDCFNLRFLMALFEPYRIRARVEPTFYYARKVCLDIATKLLRPEMGYDSLESSAVSPWEQLKIVGGGMFRAVITQAAITMSGEVVTQLEEDRAAAVSSLQQIDQLVDLLEQYSELKFKRILAMETNVKGYASACRQLAEIQSLRNGETDYTAKLMSVTKDAAERCIPILEAQVVNEIEDTSVDQPLENWFGDVFPFALDACFWDDMEFEHLSD